VRFGAEGVHGVHPKNILMPSFTLESLQKKLGDTQARWQIESLSMRPVDAALHGLGYNPHPSEPSRDAGLSIASVNRFGFQPMVGALQYPTSFDWRDVGGQNYVTIAKDQGKCNSCAAFAALAVIESMVRIAIRNPNIAIDLSEAQLFFCHGAAVGASCANGWNPTEALSSLQRLGVIDEASLPYSDHDQRCAMPQSWLQKAVKITGSRQISSTDQAKRWLSITGPLITAFDLCEDFRVFWTTNGGIYHHVDGMFEGKHLVCCIGYDDTKSCWICKNSWGPTGPLGDGCFAIQYGECGVDGPMWAVDGIIGPGTS